MTWLTVDDYKAWARIDPADTVDDAAISQAVDAIGPRIQRMCARSFDPTTGDLLPDWGDVAEGAMLWVNRLMARRNSPDGVIGVADLGTAVIRSYDADVRAMLSQALATVLA